MKILFVGARFPYPPLKGDQMRSFHQLRLLSIHHEITFVSFDDGHIEESYYKAVAELCTRVILVPLQKWEVLRSLAAGIFSTYPFQTLLYLSKRMEHTLAEVLANENYDLIHVQLARMAPYFENWHSCPRVIDLIDALSLNMQRRYQRDRGFTKLAAYIEWQRMKNYEQLICKNYDAVTVVSPTDCNVLGNYPNVHINANGVDFQQFPYMRTGRKDNMLVFTGNMGYFPNINAVCWFVEQVWPLIKEQYPTAEFYIVGANPHPKVIALADAHRSIYVTGYVEQIQEYLLKATISVVPMQAGSGMQFKVIEAMATGAPVVATPFALGGLDVTHEQHLLIAETPANFADSVVQLLNDENLQTTIAASAYTLVVEKFSWETVVAALDDLYTKILRFN